MGISTKKKTVTGSREKTVCDLNATQGANTTWRDLNG